ncbi:MAG: DUF2794 domain-containing protein [Pseudomonadota bacterium]
MKTPANEFVPSKGASKPQPKIWFQRRELSAILHVYGKMVAAGEWRDYAIDAAKDYAAFSIYRRSSEAPTYTIEKRPDLARKQGAYAVINATGQVLKRGRELSTVLKVFDKRRFSVVE